MNASLNRWPDLDLARPEEPAEARAEAEAGAEPPPAALVATAPGLAVEGRPDERAVRVLLVEDRPFFARVVRWALARATRGRFQIEQAFAFAHAVKRLKEELFDAILFDLGPRTGDEVEAALDAAEALAHRVPVIVLTGTQVEVPEAAAHADGLAAFVRREHFECDRLPPTILDAIKRHRRVGQIGADPIIYRLHD